MALPDAHRSGWLYACVVLLSVVYLSHSLLAGPGAASPWRSWGFSATLASTAGSRSVVFARAGTDAGAGQSGVSGAGPASAASGSQSGEVSPVREAASALRPGAAPSSEIAPAARLHTAPPAGDEVKLTSWPPEIDWPANIPQVNDDDVTALRRNFEKIFSWWHRPPKARRVKLLIMVTTVPKEAKLRQVHRETWMSVPGICKVVADTAVQPTGLGCHAFTAFFVGTDGATDAWVQKELAVHQDIVVLDVKDQWNFSKKPMLKPLPSWKPAKNGPWIPEEHLYSPSFNGEVKAKTRAAFEYAFKNYPWVTHYAKNDLDNFPYVAEVLEDLEDIENSDVGRSSKNIQPQSNPTPWEARHGIFYGQLMSGYMMQGQFYILDRPLLDCIWHKTDVMRCHGKPGEDAMMGCMVTNTYNVSKSLQAGIPWAHDGPCPEPWRLNIKPGYQNSLNPRWCPCKPRQCPIVQPSTLDRFCGPHVPM